MRKRSAKDDSLDIGLITSPSMTSGISQDNPVFINDSAGGDESKLRFEHLEEEEEDIEKESSEL